MQVFLEMGLLFRQTNEQRLNRLKTAFLHFSESALSLLDEGNASD